MEKEKKKGNLKFVKIIAICAIILFAGTATVFGINILKNHSGDSNTADDSSSRRSVVVNEENAEEVVSQLIEEEKTPMGYYEVTMNSTWNFENGSAVSSNAYIENATTNTNSVYFDVVRSDTGETIYSSPILPVGTHLNEVKLDSNLPAGIYDCVCTYSLLDENDNPTSTVSVSVTIVIEN